MSFFCKSFFFFLDRRVRRTRTYVLPNAISATDLAQTPRSVAAPFWILSPPRGRSVFGILREMRV